MLKNMVAILLMLVGILMVQPSNAQVEQNTSKAITIGETNLLTNWNVLHAFNDKWGMQAFYFGVSVPASQYSSEYIYIGPYYTFNEHVSLGITGGYSLNFPDNKSAPMVALNAWGDIVPKLSYYAEIDAIYGPAWFYVAKVRYDMTDNISTGLWFLGFGEQEQTLRIGPFVSYKFKTQFGSLEFVGSAFYSTDHKIIPAIAFVAWI